MSFTCNECNAVNAKLRCSGCRVVHYCNANCQRANWKRHKSVCKRAIIIPIAAPSNIDDASKDKMEIYSMHTVGQLRQKFNHRVGYTEITNCQFEPSKAMLELLIDVLLSPLTFWSVESINIQFIPFSNPLSAKQIRQRKNAVDNLFKVLPRLPKLKQLYIKEHGGCNVDTFDIRTGYIESFEPKCYRSLDTLYIPSDDVFLCPFDFSNFVSFIKHSSRIKKMEINVRYHDKVAHRTVFENVTKFILTSICESDNKFLEELSFEVGDVGDFNDDNANTLFTSLCDIIRSQHELRSLAINGRPFKHALQSHMWHMLADKALNLTELHLHVSELRPNEQAFEKQKNLLHFIELHKRLEFISLDGCVCWTPDTLRNLVDILTTKCKQMNFIRLGWILFTMDTSIFDRSWQAMMDLFRYNANMSVVHFIPNVNAFPMIDDLLPDKQIIANAITACLLNYNKYQVYLEEMMNGYIQGEKALIQEIFEYLDDDDEETKDRLIICIECPGHEFEAAKQYWALEANKIAKYVNDQIKEAVIEHQLKYVKTFEFNIY